MYPLRRIDHRKIDPDYGGIVVTCDVDKTYLDTDFESLAGLLTIPMEWAEDKRTMAGMAPVLRALRYGTGYTNAQVPFYFLTASPPSFEKVLFRKMLLDNVQCDGVTFKDWSSIITKRRKPSWLKKQIAYKLSALLHQRTFLPGAASEILIGDDAETDAVAYALYARLMAGEMDSGDLAGELVKHGCDKKEREEVLGAVKAAGAPEGGVKWIYIYLVKGTNPSAFVDYGPALIPCKSPFQIAAHMEQSGIVKSGTADQAANDMMARGVQSDILKDEITDGKARGILDSHSGSFLK